MTRIAKAELRTVSLPLVLPFRTSLGTQTVRNALLLGVTLDNGVTGWGECVAEDDPTYSPEYLDGAREVIRRFLLPAVLGLPEPDPAAVAPALRHFRGHQMAKAAVEMAVLDAWLRDAGISLSQYLGGVSSSVPVGVSVGITDTIDELLRLVAGYLDDGYSRIKLKIEPGWDIEPVRAVRQRFPDVSLQVDANTAYGRADIPFLLRLDEYALTLIEQPFDPDDLDSHTMLASRLRTPVCLDESIESARDAAVAIGRGSCSIVNIKPGRVGGYLEARSIHDVCRANEIPVWCGGMLETGLGRAANLALASLPGFVMPGDISATERYYTRDITAPFLLQDGEMAVPTGPGIGIEPDPDALADLTIAVEQVDLGG